MKVSGKVGGGCVMGTEDRPAAAGAHGKSPDLTIWVTSEHVGGGGVIRFPLPSLR